MGYTERQERAMALAMIGERSILSAVQAAVHEEFGGTYDGADIADRVVTLLRDHR